MATVISPSGTKCTAEGKLLDRLVASGWKINKKPASTVKDKADQ